MRPNIYFSQSIDERSWHVWRPVIKVGEHRGHFFFYVDSDDADAGEAALATSVPVPGA